MDFVTPLYNTLQAQAGLEHTRAVTQDTTALANNRMLTNQLLGMQIQRNVATQQAQQDWAQTQGTDPRIAALAYDPSDSPQTTLAKQVQKMQLAAEGQNQLANMIRGRGGDMAQAEKIEADATRNLHWGAYSANSALRQATQDSRDAASAAGAMVSSLESGATNDPSPAYSQLQDIIPPQQFAQYRWDTDENGSAIDGPMTRATLNMIRVRGIGADKKAHARQRLSPHPELGRSSRQHGCHRATER